MTQYNQQLNTDIIGTKTTAMYDGTQWVTPVKSIGTVEYINKGAVNVGKRVPLKATGTLNSAANVPYGTKFTLGTVPTNKMWLIATLSGGTINGVTFDDCLINNVGMGFFVGSNEYNTKYLIDYFGDFIPVHAGQKIEIMYASNASGAGTQYISYYGWEIDLT